MRTGRAQKEAGAYYTPDRVAETLLHWAIRSTGDRVLDPSCGDGRFIAGHRNSVGIEQDLEAARAAIARAPWALVHEGDFFAWAESTSERFECAAGNPPFIRYQLFNGEVRERALALCKTAGATFSGLTSSWAPFIVATSTLLMHGGRMAFVVPAEIGHAPYSVPLIEYLARNFSLVHVVAVREKLFPALSEDCWLLYVDGYGGRTEELRFTSLPALTQMRRPPGKFLRISVREWKSTWGGRLRPYLISSEARCLYADILGSNQTNRLGDLASVGIGYVTGANDFFHLRPSVAEKWRIPESLLHPAVRRGGTLPKSRLTHSTVSEWRKSDEQMLLLRIPKGVRVPAAVKKYLDSEAGHAARTAYKCRVRDPWYSVPDVQIPDFFLSYMSGLEANFVQNEAGCTCTNSVHSVRLKKKGLAKRLAQAWKTDFVRLSSELEGHPLGGGMLKLEPREAANVVIPSPSEVARFSSEAISDALTTLREWRHYAAA